MCVLIAELADRYRKQYTLNHARPDVLTKGCRAIVMYQIQQIFKYSRASPHRLAYQQTIDGQSSQQR